ncbi:MAG: hypothetical protein QNJ31_06735 [Candidatus Caenarcaniphilales bacterium]|nr:hypothetical protein [Candidatus Caenarcaniphilales bacterium]
MSLDDYHSEPKDSFNLIEEMKCAIKLTQSDLEEAQNYLDSISERLRQTTIVLSNASDLDQD